MIEKITSKNLSKLNGIDEHPIMAFVDIHGHSRRKSVFMYGPHYPLHNEKHLRVRVIPKLLEDSCDMFRYYSCKFALERAKARTARIVLFKEFNIMNCYTLEASLYGYISQEDRTTI